MRPCVSSLEVPMPSTDVASPSGRVATWPAATPISRPRWHSPRGSRRTTRRPAQCPEADGVRGAASQGSALALSPSIRQAGRAPQRLSLHRRDALVGELPEQGALESVRELSLEDLLLKKLEPLARGEAFPEASSFLADALQELGGDAATEHGADLKEAPRARLQAVHSCLEHCPHRLGQEEIVTRIALERAACQLLQEQRIAPGLFRDRFRELPCALRQQRIEQGKALVGWQRR